MSIEVKDELLKTVSAHGVQLNADVYQIGLYTNELVPDSDTTIEDVTPANFGGYDGLRDLDSWETAATWDPPRAVITHPVITWTADGTSPSNVIRGFYVVDQSGNLAWVVPNPEGGSTIGLTGQTYTVDPFFARKSEE